MIDRSNFSASESRTPFNLYEWRERFILVILRAACLLGIALLGVSFSTATSSDKVLFGALYLGLLGVTFLRVPYKLRAYAVLFTVIAIGVNSILNWGPWIDGSIFLLASVVIAALLFDERIDVIVFSVNTVFIITIAVLQSLGLYQPEAKPTPQTIPLDWANYIFNYAAMGWIIIVAIGQFKNAFTHVVQESQSALKTIAIERSRLEEKVGERTELLESKMSQLRAATAAARLIAEIQNITDLVETSTKLLAEKFGYYHVGLFILDEHKKNAYLQSASSARGKELIGDSINLEDNKKNPLALAVGQNRAIITLDIDSKNFFPEENFPLTRSRMTLPLTIRGDVIGALDLHSDQPRAFNIEDAELLQALTDLIAIAFDNVRLINETQNLVNQLQANTLIQTQRTWRKITSRQMPAYQYTPAGVRPILNREKRGGDENEGLRIPLVLYGQTIGAIKLKRKNNQAEWSEREKAFVEKIAEQVALALENSRLVEEAQKSAVRDQMIANISTRIRETLDIESVARTAALELRRVFDLKESEIFIGSLQDGNK